jgi:hypothetical protein
MTVLCECRAIRCPVEMDASDGVSLLVEGPIGNRVKFSHPSPRLPLGIGANCLPR